MRRGFEGGPAETKTGQKKPLQWWSSVGSVDTMAGMFAGRGLSKQDSEDESEAERYLKEIRGEGIVDILPCNKIVVVFNS